MDQFFHFFENLTMLGPGDNRITEDLIRSTNTKQTPLILDIGSGTGRQTRILAASAPEGRIVPVDLYIPYLQKVKDIQQVSPVCGTMEHLPFKAGTVDLI